MKIFLFNIILVAISINANARDCSQSARVIVENHTQAPAVNVVLTDDFLKFDVIKIIVTTPELGNDESQRLIEALSNDIPERDFYLVQVQDEQYLVEMDMKLCQAKLPINLGAFEIIEEILHPGM